MDFIDELRQLSKRVDSLKDILPTEEATKNALILPFFQLLGYDVFNPLEVMPEFTADVGIKKGEKVDYAIMIDGKPALLVEAKWCNETLEKHDSQLFRYFAATEAKFGILTNGIVYKFYTDLDEPNKMDLTPFLEFDMLNLNDAVVPEIRRFAKEKINIDAVFNAASELKYTGMIKAFLNQQRTEMDDAFINFIMGEVYPGKRTKAALDRFTPIIKKAYTAFLNEVINDTLKTAMQRQSPEEPAQAPKESSPEPDPEIAEAISRINTTADEIGAFFIIKAILHDVIAPERLDYKDTESYFSILCDGNIRKWICRLRLEGNKKSLIFSDDKFTLEQVDDIFIYKDRLLESAKRFI